MRRLLLSLVGAAVVAVACGDTATTTTAPAPTTTAMVTTTVAEPIASTTTVGAAAADFPLVVEGDAGPVEIPARPERVVSLSATHTEMLYALGAGDQMAGTDLTSDWPVEALDTPKVDAFNFNAEEVAALEPDLVILAFDFAGEVEALEALGIPALLLRPAATLDEAYAQYEQVGLATGHAVAASGAVATMRERIDAAFQSVPPGVAGSTVYHEIDSTFYSANSSTFLGDVYTRFGLVNVADEVPDEFGSGFVQLSPEFILDQDPTYIVLGDTAFGVTAESLVDRPGWDRLSAVADGRILELDSDISGRWGPRTVVMVEQIAGYLQEQAA